MSRHCKAVCICSRKRSSLSVDDSTARAIFVVDFLPVQMLPAMIFLFQQLECKRPNFYEQRFCIIEAGCFISCSVFFAIGLSFFIFYSFGKDRVGCLIEDENGTRTQIQKATAPDRCRRRRKRKTTRGNAKTFLSRIRRPH
ncbi:hypothetical protein L596_011448 [Steinernema carpocapsae]|uniref:Uncharacterized protein n=1 Tax=Steinernema carpocapsae TaxID=34508 RepID=A0A4U5NUC1_STECR|nr:hypothetical protein L596_011448 [Steinernema carpocapsae]